MAFGKITSDSNKVHLYVSDGTTITDFNSVFSDGFVKLVSSTTQLINSDIAIKNGKKILLEKKDLTQANALSVGDYGTYEQIEVGTETDPLCLNHSAKAPDGTVVGKNIIVNYKDTSGTNQADAIAYLSDISSFAPLSHVGSSGTSQHPLGNGTNAGFSTNDYSTLEKTKLAGIATNATATTITNNLTTSATGTALDAAQGKILQDNKAPIASPTFTGVPAAPTATTGTNTTQIATTAFVINEFPTTVTIPEI